ncbi:glycosyltransferase family 2 protein [Bifidobacterium felsineum]|uniref:glycosyltransferase family 2 protein n=1 Tax=Bifidobacterium felsineum TaxID=2045440 RepID=UPI001BDBB4A5|nr:glycosyltransferase family 2 protein [Bifidobacterium felsineum]MBT1165158.1 glycosyltransferase family 2 protein [Bifidobacterium felsineum]
MYETAKQNYKILCSVITYNPDEHLLVKNIESITNQVSELVIVDNCSNNIASIASIAVKYNVHLIRCTENFGIAKALNIAFKYAEKNEFKWVLTLDQDSVCPDNYFKYLSPLMNNIPNVGITAPVIVDRTNIIIGHKPKFDYQYVRTCITSGACTSVSAWKAVGGFDEAMFIDSVDFDFCFRLRKAGYKIVQTSLVKLDHSLGTSTTICFGKFQYTYFEHNAFRLYYIAQNNIYYPAKNFLALHFLRGNIRNILLLLRVCLFEQNKSDKIKSILKGFFNGYNLTYKYIIGRYYNE